jgi:hypothetical protein
MNHLSLSVAARFSLVVLLTLVAGWVQAAYLPNYTVLSEHHDLFVHRDATFEHGMSRVVRIAAEGGVEEMGEVSQSYNSDLATMVVTQAYVLQPDGQRVEVSPDNIKVRDAYVDSGSPIFSNEKEIFIIFPKVQVGSELHYTFHERVHEPTFPEQFNWSDYQLYWVPVESSTVRVMYDPAIRLRFDMRGGYREQTAEVDEKVHEGYRVRHFKYRMTHVQEYESGGVSLSDTAPMIMVSSWENYGAVGRAYDRRSKPKARPDSEIKSLAEKVVGDAASERERVQRLHAWVAQNIRYVGTYVGAGGFVPNPATLILKRHYGDCKDHATLLEAMLTSMGIDSSPALINLGQAFQLMPLPGPSPFNHVITYIPSLDLFVDATARYAPTGSLPLGDMGKPVLIARTGEIKTTPKPSAERDVEIVHSHWEIQPNGDMFAKSEFSKTGWLEVNSRGYASDQEEIDQERWSREYLQDRQEVGVGESHAPKSDDWSKSWRVTAITKLRNVLNLPEPSAFAIPVGVAPGTMRAFADTSPDTQRKRPWRCASRTIREVSTVDLPPSVKVQYLPKGVDIDEKQWQYRSTYQLQGLRMHIEREMVMRFDRPWCNADMAPKWAQFMERVRRDVRGQVFVEADR